MAIAKQKFQITPSPAESYIAGQMQPVVGTFVSKTDNTAQTNNVAPTTTQTQTATPTPYTDIANAYAQKARENFAQQQAEMDKQRAASIKSTNASYDSAAAGNYINYMRQQNALPEQLARQGIRGGASESAMARIGNNYALNQGNNNASRAAAIGQIQSSYDTNLANLRNSMNENILNNDTALRQSQVQYEDTLAQREAENKRYREEVERAARERAEDIAREDARYSYEQYMRAQEIQREHDAQVLEQFAATVSRFTTVKACDNAIASLQTSTDPNALQMIWLVQQRKAEIKAAKKK